MSADTDFVSGEREALRQYADWYSRQGYQVSVEPSPRELPEFLRTLAPDLIAHRDGENIVVEIKTSSPASFEQVQRLARALEHRAGWKLQRGLRRFGGSGMGAPLAAARCSGALGAPSEPGLGRRRRRSAPPGISVAMVDYRSGRAPQALAPQDPAHPPDFLIGA